MKRGLKRIAFTLLFGLILFLAGLLLSLFIAGQFDMKLQDSLFYVGIVILIAGAFAMMKGSPSRANLQGLGTKNNYAVVENLETARAEREPIFYNRNLLKNTVVEITRYRLPIIIAGIGLLLYCVYGFQ